MSDHSEAQPLHREPSVRPRWVRWVITGGVLAIGLTGGWFSWRLQDDDPWWSATMGNLAVTVVLLVPAEAALSWIRQGFRTLRAEANQVRQVAEEAQSIATRAKNSLEQIQQSLIDRQVAESNRYLDKFRAFGETASRTDLLEGLRTATHDEIISRRGVRVPVWETDLHYRFVVDEGGNELTVRLEEDGGKVISSHSWAPRATPLDFYQELVDAVRKAGRDLGVALNVPTASVKDLSDMLVEVANLRKQELLGNRDTLQRIVERRNGWYFTEDHVIPEDDLHYAIDVSRLNDMDWVDHLLDKGWTGAGMEIPFARRLYGAHVEDGVD